MFKMGESETGYARGLDNNKKEEETYLQRVLVSLEQADFRELLHEKIIQRLLLLERETRFNEDARNIERGTDNVLDLLEKRYGDQNPQLRFSAQQRADARMAAILHDIGKSGPAEATVAEQEIIVKIFAYEKIINQELPVRKVLVEIFGESEGERKLRMLQNCGIDSQATMRQFWDRHAQWTHDILEACPQGLDKNIRVIASSHHIDHGINPYALPESKIPLETKIIGTLEEYADALKERVLIALDQYEASVRRSGSSHEAAFAWVRKNLAKFKNDELMNLVLDAIDELGQQEKIFAEK